MPKLKRKHRLAVEMVLPYLEEFPSLDNALSSAYKTLKDVIKGMGGVESPKNTVQVLEAALYEVAGKKIASHLVMAALDPAQVEKYKKSKGKNLFKETVSDLLKGFMKGQEARAEKEYVDQAIKAGSKLLMGSFDFIYNAATEVTDGWISTTTGEPTEEIMGRTHVYDIIDGIAYLTALKGVLETADPDTWSGQKSTVERKLGKQTAALAKSIWEHGLSKKSKKKLKKVDPSDEASKLKAELLKLSGSAAKQTIPKVLTELEKFAKQILEYSAQEDEPEQKAASFRKRRAEFYDNDPEVEEVVVKAITPFMEKQLNQYEDWFVDSEEGDYLWNQFDRLVEDWIYEIAQVVTWAESSGTGDVSSLDYYDYPREISSTLFKLTPGSESQDNIYYYLKEIETTVIDAAFEAAARAVENERMMAARTTRKEDRMPIRRRRRALGPYAYEDVEDDIRSVVGGLTPILDRLPALLRMSYQNSLNKYKGSRDLEDILEMFRNVDEKIEDAVEELKMLATM